MPFDVTDPRSTLAVDAGLSPAVARSPGVGFARSQVLSFVDHEPDRSPAGSRTWRVRTQNLAVAYTEAVAGDSLLRRHDRFEHLVVLPDPGTAARVTTESGAAELTGPGIAVVPPGSSSVSATTGGVIVSVYTSAADDVIRDSITSARYDEVPPHVTVLEPADADPGLRCYSLTDYPPDPSRFGHIFRSQNLMVNFVPDRQGPREITKLSPHSHPDFEQCTVQLAGRFVHHARTPWTPDATTWHEDEHLVLDGPGIAIFPPPIEHTSQAVGAGANRLLDVFAPPRNDFLSKPGWVLNTADYDDGTADHR